MRNINFALCTLHFALCTSALATQLEALDLPGSRLRQLVNELDPAGAFVGRHFLLAVVYQFSRQFRRSPVALVEDHNRLGFDQIGLVGVPNYSTL